MKITSPREILPSLGGNHPIWQVSICIYLCYVYLSLCVCLPVSVSLYVSVFLICLRLNPSFCLCLCLYLSFSLCLPSLYLCISLFLSFCFFFWRCFAKQFMCGSRPTVVDNWHTLSSCLTFPGGIRFQWLCWPLSSHLQPFCIVDNDSGFMLFQIWTSRWSKTKYIFTSSTMISDATRAIPIRAASVFLARSQNVATNLYCFR